MPAEQERAEMLQEFWDEGYGAEGDDEAYDWDTDEWQISDHEQEALSLIHISEPTRPY